MASHASPPLHTIFVAVVVVIVISDASQTLRVGYGRFVSDLPGHVEKSWAKARADTGTEVSTGPAEAEAEAGGRAVRAGGRQRAEDGNKNETSTGSRTAGDLPNPGVLAGGGPASGAAATVGLGVEAAALGGLQRFGGECLRSLAEGAAFA